MGDKSYALVEKSTDNDYVFMTIYDLNSDTAEKKDVLNSYIDKLIRPADPGALRLVSRCNLLSTYSVVRLNKMYEDGSIKPEEEFGYMENSLMPPLRLKTTVDVKMLDDEEGKSMHDVTLGSQTELYIYRTDMEKTVDFKLKDGNIVRFAIEEGGDGMYGEMINDIPIEEVFEEMFFAG